MPSSEARVETALARRYAEQLCKHFAHKIPVTDEGAEGSRIAFPFGATRVRAEDGALVLRAEAEDEAALGRVEGVVANHLARFAFREAPEVAWRR